MHPKPAVWPFKPKTYVLRKIVYFPVLSLLFPLEHEDAAMLNCLSKSKLFQAVCQKYSNIVSKLLAEEQLGHNCQHNQNSVRNVMKINKKEKVFHTYA